MKKFDVLIIGGGPGGYVAAIKAAQEGLSVGLIEKEALGGVCLNHGCIPTKSLINSAEIYNMTKSIGDFGINVADVSFDWAKIIDRKDSVVKQLTSGVSFLLKKNKVEVFSSVAKVLSPTEVEVNGEAIECKNLIIATGASAFLPPILGLKEAYEKGFVLTYRQMLNVKEIPKELVIIGGGSIGVEFAIIYNSFGTKVTIIELQDSILPFMDQDIKAAFSRRLKRDGINIITGANVTSIKEHTLFYDKDSQSQQISADLILCAVGTKPNLAGLEKLNLQLENNAIKTDEYLQTNIKGVYAIGDVNGKYMLAHVASHEGLVAVANIKGHVKKMRYDVIPMCVYSSPEIAFIGMTEAKAISSKINYKVVKIPIGAVGKALCDGQKEGFIKLVVQNESLKILGVHIYAEQATELISQFGIAMTNDLSAFDISATIFPHPTLSELTLEAVLEAINKAIHA